MCTWDVNFDIFAFLDFLKYIVPVPPTQVLLVQSYMQDDEEVTWVKN